MAGSAVTCDRCGAFFSSLAELSEAGAEIRTLGLSMRAKCPECGRWFAIGQAWSKRPSGIDKNKLHKEFEG